MDDYTKVLITAIIAIIGWIIAHYFTAKRDLKNKQREFRTSYLVEAYRKLEHSTSAIHPEKHFSNMEQAVADIQLFGSRTQIQLAKKFIADMASYDQAKPQPLLFELRQSLRHELDLQATNEEIKHLRFNSKKSVNGN